MNKSNTYRPGGDPKADIDILRQVIDEIDEKILDLINQRLSLAKQIGDFKKKGGIQITDSGREPFAEEEQRPHGRRRIAEYF
jgi:hypothetical protein